MALGHLLAGQVMHKRTFPKVNAFTYGIYYLCLPLESLPSSLGMFFGVNRAGLVSFHTRDHGARDGTDLAAWARARLGDNGIDSTGLAFTLVCMPRVFGYVFNPVSFWLCRSVDGALRAVICEVNNTFGETHSYLCAHGDGRPITQDTWLEAKKIFHVSPFLERAGQYRFRFAVTDGSFGAWIDFFDADGEKQLLTSLVGRLQPLTRQSLTNAFFKYPLVSLVAIGRIHWQAVRLIFKGIRHITKPQQLQTRTSRGGTLTEN